MLIKKINPLFKYIGGKTWLKETLREEVLKSINYKKISTYAEPFTGGLGSFLCVYDILLHNDIKNILLSDINKTLIHTYQTIKGDHKKLIKEFLLIEKQFFNIIPNNWKQEKNKIELKKQLKEAELFFNTIKNDFNINKDNIDIKQSARLIFLQKHSFNGIYRENSKGEYNTPFNWSGNTMLDTIETKINEINYLFNQFNLKFIAQSFEKIEYNNKTLYYLDPPYFNEKTSENKYNKNIFTFEDQILLLDKIRNTTFIYSNHKSKTLTNELNKINGINIRELARRNIISASSLSRKEDKIEILVTKY